jgi:hypothetical protein
MSVEETFIAAARARHLCELTDAAGNIRLVEPYMVFTSSRGRRLFHCYLLRVYLQPGRRRGWRNPPVERIVEARIVDQPFTPRASYNPRNERLFPVVHFAIEKDEEHRAPSNA